MDAHNDEIAIDIAGPFQLPPKTEKYLIVSIDHKTNWPNAAFVTKPTAERIVNFLSAHIAQFGIPKRIRRDTATIFRGELFKQFCQKHFIQHIECSKYDHRGNGKVERLIGTINERLRADKSIITERGNAGLARLLFALRTAAAANKNSPFEQVFGGKPNTVKEIITEKPNHCLENDNTVKLSPDEFPKDDDSTIFQRDQTTNTKLEGQFEKKSGPIVAESDHTVTMETKRERQVISKRHIAKKKSASHIQKTNTKIGISHSLERKIAALKDADERSEMELNKPLKFFAAKDYKNIPPKKNRSPRKQTKPKKSLTKLPDKTADILGSSSDEDNKIIQQETKKEDNTDENKNNKQDEQDTKSNTSRQSQRPKRRPDWYGQNIMVSNTEEPEGELSQTNEPQLNKEIQEELEAIPNFEEMTQQEIDEWVNN